MMKHLMTAPTAEHLDNYQKNAKDTPDLTNPPFLYGHSGTSTRTFGPNGCSRIAHLLSISSVCAEDAKDSSIFETYQQRYPKYPLEPEIPILFGAKVPSQVSQKIRSIDPEEAVVLIQAINRVYDLKVDTKELLKKVEEIKKKLKELADQH
jgi:hypothetical protein